MRQLAGPSDTLSGGTSGEGGGGGGSYEAPIEADLLRFIVWRPIGDRVAQKEGTRVRGRGRTPLFLSHRHTAPVCPHN